MNLNHVPGPDSAGKRPGQLFFPAFFRKKKAAAMFFMSMLVFCAIFLCGCQKERIGVPGETGEWLSSGRDPVRSEEQAACQESFSDFCLNLFCSEAAGNTLDLHYTLKNPESWGINPGEPSLGSFHLADMIAANQEIRELKDVLLSYDRALLSPEQQFVYDVLLDNLETSLTSEGMELYAQPLSPTIGTQAQLPILLSEYSFETLKDVEDYLAILSQIDEYYGQLLTFENQKAEARLGPSDASIDGILASCRSYLIDPEDNFLTETFRTRLDGLEGVTEEQKADLSARHVKAIREHFIPAYELLIEGMTALKGRGIHDGGLAQYKDGKQYYEYLVKAGTGTSYTIPQLKEALARRMEDDLTAISRIFLEDPDFDPDSCMFSLTEPDKILDDLQRQIKRDFPALPDYSYEIKYVPKYLESSLSPAFYLTAPLDDLNQNVIYINNGSAGSSGDLYTTLAHEGFPGHLYQTVYSRSHAASPLLSLLGCSGANEGWATYAENYACTLENGLTEAQGTYLSSLRSFSLCVHSLLDIGINYDGWSREQAGEFIRTYFNADDETVENLWQTMIDNPANYLEYCCGYIEIMEMKAEAEEALGPSFNLMEFHRFLLDIGPVPYSVTREYFSQWLKKQ